MTMRTVSVDAICHFTFEVDDEAVSNWDGAKILTVLVDRSADPSLHTPEATQDGLLAHLGVALSIENRRMGHIDGWADFPESAARGNPYGIEWEIDRVDVR